MNITHDIEVKFNGHTLDINEPKHLKILLDGIVNNDSDLIEPINEFVLEHMASFRAKLLLRIQLLSQAVSSTVFFNNAKPAHMAGIRAHWERAFKGYNLSQFDKYSQKFYLKLCKHAPIPKEYGQIVEIGIVNDL